MEDRPTFAPGLPPALKVESRDFGSSTNHQSVEPGPPQDPVLERKSRAIQSLGANGRYGDNDSLLQTTGASEDDLIDCNKESLGREGDYTKHENCRHTLSARDWSISRKRLVAIVSCINTSCIGMILGIYAGEVPAIQYVIIDLDHSIILGNVLLYLGLAISCLIFWPLPLLHGRKPYVVGSLTIALCLQIPQGLAVSDLRLPDSDTWKYMLLSSRAVSGLALGFCDINVQNTLLDLFGASLQSLRPHQEAVDQSDVRRHGGGIGLWLGIWSWCSIGPICFGFMIGASIIDRTSVTWGFWVSLLILMVVLLLNIVSPEVRRSAFRRTFTQSQEQHYNRCETQRGEIKMHLDSESPSHWGEEIMAGLRLCKLMVSQPGFMILSVYTAWVYAQFTLILMLLGALASQIYRYRPAYVGLCVVSLSSGALIATPFQKASWLSRARRRAVTSNSMTLKQKFDWSSHFARRAIFTLSLPLAAVAYTLSSRGPPLSIAVPCIMAGFVGFFSALAIAECCGFILETFDTSDLQSSMTGRRGVREPAVLNVGVTWTRFSCYPRVSAGLAVTQALKYSLGAAATGVCGRVERRLGAIQATAVVAGVLLLITTFLTLVLVRWKTVTLVPHRKPINEKDCKQQRHWRPGIVEISSGTTRKISILEAGRMSRWSEIRRGNKISTRLTGG